jgi:hypothetical protein
MNWDFEGFGKGIKSLRQLQSLDVEFQEYIRERLKDYPFLGIAILVLT